MNIVYAVTKDYYRKMIPSVTSLIEHNPKAKIYIVTEADEVPCLPVEPTVVNIAGQRWFHPSGLNYRNQYSYINLLKVCYPELLKVNKVIHLDVDTIICDSLEEMWKTNVTGKWFAAVDEKLGRYHPFGPVYYNMGVALINLAQIRKDGGVSDMVTYLNTVPQPYADQDAWNKFGKGVELDVRYNECFATGKTDDPAIVHYCGRGDWYENKFIDRREYLDRYLK